MAGAAGRSGGPSGRTAARTDRRERRGGRVLIEGWMTRRVHVVKPRDPIRRAREIMETHRVNQLPVVVDQRVVGIVTDRDLRDAYPSVFDPEPRGGRRGAGPAVADPDHITVESVMTPNVVVLGPKDSVVEAARRMRRERIGAIPVVADGHLVGIIARSDILDAFVALAEPDHPDAPRPRTPDSGPQHH